jgi:hypothetical protein
MKEFMFIFKGPTYDQLDMSAEAAQAQMQKWFSWVNELKNKGQYVDGRPLTSAPSKIVSGVKQMVTDGPFTESKELVGGYFIIKANNIEEAVAATKGFPDYALEGSVEIREVQAIPNM